MNVVNSRSTNRSAIMLCNGCFWQDNTNHTRALCYFTAPICLTTTVGQVDECSITTLDSVWIFIVAQERLCGHWSRNDYTAEKSNIFNLTSS